MPNARNARLIVGMLLLMLAIPLAADVLLKEGSNPVVRSALVDVKDAQHLQRDTVRALEDRVRERAKQRQFWQAMREYQNRVRDGEEGLTPPDVNDYESIMFYLRESDRSAMSTERVHAAAEEEEAQEEEEKTVSSLTVDDLTEKDRLLLRRYSKAGSCPESLQDYGLSGFYELCVSVTEKPSGEPRRGLMNVNQWLRGRTVPSYEGVPAWKVRMLMLKEALDRSNRRESVFPGRPE